MHIFIKVYLKHQKFSLFLHKGAVWGNVFGRAGVLCSVGSVFVSRVHRMDMGKRPFRQCALLMKTVLRLKQEEGWKYEAVFLPVCGGAASKQHRTCSVLPGSALSADRWSYVHHCTGRVHPWPFADHLHYGRSAERPKKHPQGV